MSRAFLITDITVGDEVKSKNTWGMFTLEDSGNRSHAGEALPASNCPKEVRGETDGAFVAQG